MVVYSLYQFLLMLTDLLPILYMSSPVIILTVVFNMLAKTGRALKTRFREHLYKVRNNKRFRNYLYTHFKITGHAHQAYQ